MKTSLLSTVLVLAVVIIVAIIAFIRVKKKGTCGCGKEDCECCSCLLYTSDAADD